VDTTITTIEMCAGYGGIGLGLKNIFGGRMRTLAYCELEGFAQANLISKMEKGLMDVAPLWNDLKTFPYGSFHGLVDILIAGYPCQPFSAAGKRAGKEDPRHLWPWIADGIRLLRPKLCFFENVEGHISLGLREVVGELESMGYKVSWGIFSAREVGAPHQRKRVFIMAHLKCEGLEGLYKWHTPSEQTQLVGADSGASGQCSAWEGELAYTNTRGQSSGINARSGATQDCGGQGYTLQTSGVWPSRPGEPQQGWEPPRVVANSVIVGRGRGSDGDAGGMCWEIQATGSCCGGGEEVVGNSSTEGLQGCGTTCEMDRESGGTESEGCESAPAPAFASDAHGREGVGNTLLHGHAPTQISGGTSQSKAERGLQESEGGSASMGNAESKQGTPRDHRGQQGSFSQQEQVESGGGDCGTLRESNGQTQPTLGGDFDGTSDRLDYAELQVTCDNRTDELRLLGNGVVPATAERAFRILLNELTT